MLTPAEIRNITFKRSFNGYNYEEVDSFISQVQEGYEALYSENAELLAKLDVLIESVEKYREEEEMLKCAIINAQKMGDSIIRNAQNKAELMLAEAQIKCEKVEEQCRAAAKHKQEEFEQLQRSIADFKEKLMNTYKTHLEQIKELPSYEDQQEAAQGQADEIEKAPAADYEPPMMEKTIEESFDAEAAETHNETQIEVEAQAEEDSELKVDSGISDGDTMEFSVDLKDHPPVKDETDEERAFFENYESSSEREIFFGADYKIEPDEDKKRGLFGRKR